MGVVHRPNAVRKLEGILGDAVELIFDRGETDHGRKEVTGTDSLCDILDSHSNGRTTICKLLFCICLFCIVLNNQF